MAFFPEFLCCLCMSLDYSSVFILKENTQGGRRAQAGPQKQSFPGPREHVMLASHKSAGCLQETESERERETKVREGESQREGETEREKRREREEREKRERERECLGFWR